MTIQSIGSLGVGDPVMASLGVNVLAFLIIRSLGSVVLREDLFCVEIGRKDTQEAFKSSDG